MKCERCGATLKKSDTVCPVCGESVVEVKNELKEISENTKAEYAEPEKTSSDNDTACLVCGILSFLGLCGVGTILAIIAIVLGAKIKKETNKMPAGMICGIISLSIQILLVLIIASIFIVAAILGVDS